MIKNYTTEVAEEKTVGEITCLLAAKGARTIQINYDAQSRPDAVSFILPVQVESGGLPVPIPFRLPCNFDGVFKAIKKQRRDPFGFDTPKNREQARRVAWRIVKNWVEAQIALIEADCAALAQVFLPYAVVMETPSGGITMFDRFMAQVSSQRALSAPAEEVAPTNHAVYEQALP